MEPVRQQVEHPWPRLLRVDDELIAAVEDQHHRLQQPPLCVEPEPNLTCATCEWQVRQPARAASKRVMSSKTKPDCSSKRPCLKLRSVVLFLWAFLVWEDSRPSICSSPNTSGCGPSAGGHLRRAAAAAAAPPRIACRDGAREVLACHVPGLTETEEVALPGGMSLLTMARHCSLPVATLIALDADLAAVICGG